MARFSQHVFVILVSQGWTLWINIICSSIVPVPYAFDSSLITSVELRIQGVEMVD